MRILLLRLLLNALALWLVAQFYGGLYFAAGSGWAAYLLAGLVFGLINALLKPLLLWLTLPLNILTLGLFTLVVNALVLWGVAALTPLEVRGFWGAFWGAILLALVSLGLGWLVGPKGHRSG